MSVGWDAVRHFRPVEFGDATKVDERLVYVLDDLRDFIGQPIVIHEAVATAGHAPNSEHYAGRAADCHAEGIALLDFFIAATRFTALRGIGVYPHWARPGLHLDVRTSSVRSYWWRDDTRAPGDQYQALDAASWKEVFGASH